MRSMWCAAMQAEEEAAAKAKAAQVAAMHAAARQELAAEASQAETRPTRAWARPLPRPVALEAQQGSAANASSTVPEQALLQSAEASRTVQAAACAAASAGMLPLSVSMLSANECGWNDGSRLMLRYFRVCFTLLHLAYPRHAICGLLGGVHAVLYSGAHVAAARRPAAHADAPEPQLFGVQPSGPQVGSGP